MIIVKLNGGLGNQMFQYAAGRGLSIQHRTLLKLDTSFFWLNGQSSDTYRNFELEHFDIKAKIASCDEIQASKYKNEWWLGKKLREKRKKPQNFSKNYISEPYFHYWNKFHQLSDNCYLDGYWQSEKYFPAIKDELRKEFSLKIPVSNSMNKLSSLALSKSSVAIHVRRGDYVSDFKTNNYHGTCSFQYYQRAIKFIKNFVITPIFFIFSDDINWVRKKFRIKEKMFFVGNELPNKPHEDLALMNICSHHIIANSSFSWWGAWLNKNPDKIIISPQKWFNKATHDTKDLIPSSWYKI